MWKLDGARLRAMRLSRRNERNEPMTQKQLALAVGCSVPFLSKSENPEHHIDHSIAFIGKLVNYFDCPFEWLIRDELDDIDEVMGSDPALYPSFRINRVRGRPTVQDRRRGGRLNQS